jgi:glutamate--cysteine ligase
MRAWLQGDGPRAATRADLDYHLTTLFPPIRPRGFLELRVIDTQPGADWEVPTAVVTALMEDEQASRQVCDACLPADDLAAAMVVAARDGLSDPGLATSALAIAKAAVDALDSVGADALTRARVTSFVERYTAVGRSPADDRLDAWQRSGNIDPFPHEETR